MDILFESEPMRIGEHEWRMEVYECLVYGKVRRYIRYQWRRLREPLTGWQDHDRWPSYNFNDGTYYGCPKSLRQLYAANKAAIAKLNRPRVAGILCH